MIVLRQLTGPLMGQTVETRKAEIRIGRDPEAEVSFAAHNLPRVSRDHACIRFQNSWYELIDEHSANGTWLGRQRVEGPTRLREGDIIRLGGIDGPSMEVQFVYDRAHFAALRAPPRDPLPAFWIALLVAIGLTLALGVVAMVYALS